MVNTAANQEREMRVAVERVVGFAQEFGEAHLNLACHAAFPLSLTPDLLYQIWANFVPEAPWSAVARVLLSRLCKQVGSEMYEMDNAVRNLLLRELKVQFEQERFDLLGEFLLEYVSQRLTDDDPDTQDLRQAQEWTALAYTKPEQAARELAQVLSDKVQQEDVGEVLRLSSLVETLSEPLVEAGFEPLLIYGQGMKSYLCGEIELARKRLETIFSQKEPLTIAGIKPYLPKKLSLAIEHETNEVSKYISEVESEDVAIANIQETKFNEVWLKTVSASISTVINFWNQLQTPINSFIENVRDSSILRWVRLTRYNTHFSTLHTKYTDGQILIKSVRDLGFLVNTDSYVRGLGGKRVRADIVVILPGECDLGYSENSDGSFDLIADLWGLAEKHNQTELINSINQKYAVNKTLADIKSRGLSQFDKKKCPRCDSVQISRQSYSKRNSNYKCNNCGTQFTVTESKL